jgi:hypothetical protein
MRGFNGTLMAGNGHNFFLHLRMLSENNHRKVACIAMESVTWKIFSKDN